MPWMDKLRTTFRLPETPAASDEPEKTAQTVLSASASAAAAPSHDPDFVDVRQLMATLSLEELCQTAEDYFRNIPDPMGLVVKPLRAPHEVSHHLVRFCQVLEGLELRPGLTVLDFGAGPGWASRMLTQLGCRVILTDVSPSALNIARALYEKLPPIGDVPPPTFLHFDGRRLDLPDGSVDRIFCFDAFHHVPNPDEIISEMGRVLAPGGIAGFSEPGPNHSASPESQAEMRNFRVVENDVRIEEIWSDAQKAGFDDLRLGAFYVPSHLLSLRDFDSFLQGGPPLMQYAETVRNYMQGLRLFFLHKAFVGGDSASNPEGLRCQLTVSLGSVTHPVTGVADITNTGTATWRTYGGQKGAVRLGCHLYDAAGNSVSHDLFHLDLRPDGATTPVLPGETVHVSFSLGGLIPSDLTSYRLAFDLVSEGVIWFAEVSEGAPPVNKEIGESA